MSIIKQLATYDGSAWTKDDIGANASNVSLSSNIAGSNNVQGALSNLCGASKLAGSSAIVTNSSGVLTASSVTSTELGYLSGATSNIQTQINTLNNNLSGNKIFPNTKDILSMDKEYDGFSTIIADDLSELTNFPPIAYSSGTQIVAFRQQQCCRDANGTIVYAIITIHMIWPGRGQKWVNYYKSDASLLWREWIMLLNSQGLNIYGAYWTAEWGASSSTLNTKLVESPTALPPGTYIVAINAPTMSTNCVCHLRSEKNDYIIAGSQRYHNINTGTSICDIIQLTPISGEAKIYLQSDQSTSVTYSNLDRGYMRVLRVR